MVDSFSLLDIGEVDDPQPPPITETKPAFSVDDITSAVTSVKLPKISAEKSPNFNKYDDLIRDAADRTNIPFNVLKSVIQTESSFRPNVTSATSSARGLMQVTKAASADVGVDHDKLLDPATNIDAGSKYLARMIAQFGLEGGIKAYNVGPNNYRKNLSVDAAQQYYDKIIKNDPTGDVTSIVSEFGRGAAEVGTSLIKAGQIAVSGPHGLTLDAFDRIDDPNTFQSMPAGERFIYRNYIKASPAQRTIIRNSVLEKYRAVRDAPAWKFAENIDKHVADALPVRVGNEGDFWKSKVPHAVGQTFGFLATNFAGRAAGVNPLATTAGAGGALQAVEGFEDALNRGATIEDAMKSAKWNFIPGLSEAIPISRMLTRLNKPIGNRVKASIQNAIKQGTEEAIQEAFQNITSNLIASKIVKYDPERQTFTGTGESASVGFTVGNIMGFLFTVAAPGRRRGGVTLGQPQAALQQDQAVSPVPSVPITAPTEPAVSPVPSVPITAPPVDETVAPAIPVDETVAPAITEPTAAATAPEINREYRELAEQHAVSQYAVTPPTTVEPYVPGGLERVMMDEATSRGFAARRLDNALTVPGVRDIWNRVTAEYDRIRRLIESKGFNFEEINSTYSAELQDLKTKLNSYGGITARLISRANAVARGHKKADPKEVRQAISELEAELERGNEPKISSVRIAEEIRQEYAEKGRPVVAPREPETRLQRLEVKGTTDKVRPPASAPPQRHDAPRLSQLEVITPTGRKVSIEFSLMEASDLKAATGDLQPRDRSRAASEEQITDMAANLMPELLGDSASTAEGAPIVGPDNVIEVGNGRVQAIRYAYARGLPGGAVYRDWLIKQGYYIEGMKNPILVRRRVNDLSVDERRKFVEEANQRTNLGMAQSEQAGVDANRLTPDIISLYQGGNISSAANREFLRRIIQDVIPQAERANVYTKEGELTPDGLSRIENALFAHAYGDLNTLAALREDADANFKAVGKAMIDAAPAWATMRANTTGELDITKDLEEALRLIRLARTKNQKIIDTVSQRDAFTVLTPNTERLLRLMFRDENFTRPRSRTAIGDVLSYYATEAARHTGEAALFEDTTTPEEILEGARVGLDVDLFGVDAPSITPTMAEPTAAAPAITQPTAAAPITPPTAAAPITPPTAAAPITPPTDELAVEDPADQLELTEVAKEDELLLTEEVPAPGFQSIRREQVEPTQMPLLMPSPEEILANPGEAGKYAASINLDRLNTPTDVQNMIFQIAQIYNEFQAARRGTVTWDQTAKEASKLGLTVEQVSSRHVGETYNAAQILAARNMQVASAEYLHYIAVKMKQTGAPADRLEAQRAYQQHLGIMEQVAGATTEAARALNIHRKLTEEGYGQRAEIIKSIIQETGGETRFDQVMDHISSLTSEQISTFIEKAKKATTLEMIREAWYMALLSNPVTQGVNVGSNALVATLTVPEHFMAGLIGKLHGGEKVYLRETYARAFGILMGSKVGLHAAVNTWASEEPSDLSTKLEYARRRSLPSLMLRRGKTKKKIAGIPIPFTGEIEIGGKQVRAPGRALLAGDELFKGIGYVQKVYELAMRDGIQNNKRGRALTQHIEDFIRPENLPEWAHKEAKEAARFQTFTNALGTAGQQVMALRETLGPVGWGSAPFIRTPVNIFKFTIKRTPLVLISTMAGKGEVSKQIRKGGAERDIALGRIAFGSSVAALVASYGLSGEDEDNPFITGGGNTLDRNEWNAKYAQGWRPYSIRWGDKYISYAAYEPVGSLIGLSVDIGVIFSEIPEIATQDEWERVGSLVTMAFVKNLTSKTYMRSLREIIRAIDDPDRYGTRFFTRLAATVIPAVIAQRARQGDPFQREATTMLDEFKARIPGLRETIPTRLDIFGNEMKYGGTLGPDIISRMYISDIKDDPTIDELVRLEAAPSTLKREISKIKLTDEQYREFVMRARQPAKTALDREMSSATWNRQTDGVKRKIIRDIFNFYREEAKHHMYMRFPDLFKQTQMRKIEELN